MLYDSKTEITHTQMMRHLNKQILLDFERSDVSFLFLF